MPPSRAWIYVGLGAAVTAVGLVELLSGPTLRPGDRVLLIGDSLAVGLAVPLGALAKERKIPFQGIGVVGTRIDQWASSAALEQALRTFQPTVVLISLGTNDAYMQGLDVAVRQAPFTDELLTKIEAAGPRAIVWISPPTLPAKAGELAHVRELISAQHAITFPRVRPRVSIFPSERLVLARAPDQIHPVASGYAAWAGAIWQWLT